MPRKDKRIKKLVQAAHLMEEGKFSVAVPALGHDDIAVLGQALKHLGGFLEKRFKELHELSSITQKINAGIVLDDMLNYAYETLRSIIPYDRMGLSFLEEGGKVMRARWAKSTVSELKIDKGYSAKIEGSSLWKIIETGHPRIINDLTVYLKEHPNSESTKLIVAEGVRSSLTCPLIALGKPIGVMFFSSMKPNTYSNVHVGIFQQIASEFSIIAEKSRLYERLLELNQTKNELLGMAAHDLRNPLAVILEASALLLESKGKLDDEQENFINMIKRTSQYMLSIVENCLDVAQIESGKLELRKEDVKLPEFIERIAALNRIFAKKKNIGIKIENPANLKTVEFDSKRIEQVLNNLLSNAIKYSNAGTEVTVEIKQNDQETTVAVRDQGQGIPQDEIGKLFLPFSKTSIQATAGEKSTGLGLLISRKIIESHNGKIWVESEFGKGSVFLFSLPV